MTNEEIKNKWYSDEPSFDDLLNLARQDEREKMAKEMAGLSYKETALVLLNYLLRGEVTDDDLRGLRLQWIADEQHSASGKIFNSAEAFEEYIAKKRQLFKENNPFYHVPLELECEKMQGVDLSKMSEMLRSNSKETWIAARGSDEGWDTWWKKRNQLNTN